MSPYLPKVRFEMAESICKQLRLMRVPAQVRDKVKLVAFWMAGPNDSDIFPVTLASETCLEHPVWKGVKFQPGEWACKLAEVAAGLAGPVPT